MPFKLQVDIVSAGAQIFSGSAEMVVVPSVNGELRNPAASRAATGAPQTRHGAHRHRRRYQRSPCSFRAASSEVQPHVVTILADRRNGPGTWTRPRKHGIGRKESRRTGRPPARARGLRAPEGRARSRHYDHPLARTPARPEAPAREAPPKIAERIGRNRTRCRPPCPSAGLPHINSSRFAGSRFDLASRSGTL